MTRKKEDAKLIIGGCITRTLDQKYELFQEVKEVLSKVDYVVKENPIFNILNILEPDMISEREAYLRVEKEHDSCVSTLHIARGCQNKCTFCKTNYVDFKLESKTEEDVKEMIDQSVEMGAKSLYFSASNLAQYGIDLYNKPMLHKLLKYTREIDEIKWIFLNSTCVPDMYDQLIDEIALNQKIKFMRMPIQTGSDKLLKLMNRKHTALDLRNIVNRIREGNPHLYIETAIITGFPMETKDDVKATAVLVKELDLYVKNNYKYLDSKGIPSSKLVQYTEKEKDKLDAMHYRMLIKHNRDLIKRIRKYPLLVDNITDEKITALTTDYHSYSASTNYSKIKKLCQRVKIGDEIDPYNI